MLGQCRWTRKGPCEIGHRAHIVLFASKFSGNGRDKREDWGFCSSRGQKLERKSSQLNDAKPTTAKFRLA